MTRARNASFRSTRPRIAPITHYWHVFVPGVEPGQLYGYHADGPFDAWQGKRFDASKLLLDPYAKAIAVPRNYNRGEGWGQIWFFVFRQG